MYRNLVFVVIVALSGNAFADSFRCGGSVIKNGDTEGKLQKKCGQPRSKHVSRTEINNHGNRYDSVVINWVYDRGRNKDMIVSVRNGVVIKIEPD